MGRYERSIQFERLIELRAAYQTLGAADRFVAISIADAVALAQQALSESRAREAASTNHATPVPDATDPQG